jgi:hypothetical protein
MTKTFLSLLALLVLLPSPAVFGLFGHEVKFVGYALPKFGEVRGTVIC